MTMTPKEKEEEEEQKNDNDDIDDDDDDDGSICYGVLPEPEFFDYCSLTFEEIQMMCQATSLPPAAAASSPGGGGITTRARLARRQQQQRAKFVPLSQISSRDVLRIEPMTWWNEGLCICFLSFVVPLGVFTLPPVVALLGYSLFGWTIRTSFLYFGVVVLLPLTLLPQPYVPATLQSHLALQIGKYFSFRFILEERPHPRPTHSNRSSTSRRRNSEKKVVYRPTIMVAPPHGVFPYGNILSMVAFPALLQGQTFRGLASSAALRPPIFKQVLRSIGVIDASRDVARATLDGTSTSTSTSTTTGGVGESIGISTGGVAEIFLTNTTHECILLKERIGLIKLAIRTGANIAPCYLFGNTKLLHCWFGEGLPYVPSFLERWSRKFGFALIWIHGRFGGFPIPFRKPILAVYGKHITTYEIQNENPTPEQIDMIQKQLLSEIDRIFTTYKPYYEWNDKHLIIK